MSKSKKKVSGAEGNEETVISIEQTERRIETEVVEGSSANMQMEMGGQEEDEDSGIGIVATTTRNKMLEKKSVFTIAYDDVAQKTPLQNRPDTASNNETEAETKS